MQLNILKNTVPGRTGMIVAIGVAATLTACGSPVRQVTTAKPGAFPTTSAGVEVPAGTSIPVVAVVDIASREGVSDQPTATPQHPYFAVLEDVTNESGAVVVPAGTKVNASITRRSNPRIGRPGWLEVSFKSTKGIDGSVIRLDDAPQRFEGKSRIKGSVTLAVFTYGLGLLRSGGDVTLPEGTGLTAQVVN
ncbi:MAG: hypothetical protein AAF436_07685 [Myxococcota bacterium]